MCKTCPKEWYCLIACEPVSERLSAIDYEIADANLARGEKK